MKIIACLLSLILLNTASFSQGYILDSIYENNGYTYVSRPTGNGPFPGVLYSHGGLGSQIGGDLRETSISLAESGYICLAKLRSDTLPISPHVSQVDASLDSLLSLSNIDLNNIGIIGFSRGGLLTLMTAVSRPFDVKAIVTMAPAAANSALSTTLAQVSAIDDSVLILVSLNDLYQDNHVQLALDVKNALYNEGKDYRHIEYDPYDSNFNGVIDSGDDGHELFWKVQDPYWSDLIFFLDNNLKNNTTKIEEPQVNKKVLVVPNPVDDIVKIMLENNVRISKVNIYNTNGVLLNKYSVDKTMFLLNMEEYRAGIYIIEVFDRNNNRYRGKIIVK